MKTKKRSRLLYYNKVSVITLQVELQTFSAFISENQINLYSHWKKTDF
jgi:hypothetical protein